MGAVFVSGGGGGGTPTPDGVFLRGSVTTLPSYGSSLLYANNSIYATVLSSIYQYNLDTLSEISNIPLGNTARALCNDDTYIYSSANNKLKKITMSNNAVSADGADYGGDIKSMAVDDSYIYVGGITTNAIKKCSKSNISSWSATGTNYGMGILTLEIDDTYIYYAGFYSGGVGGTIVKAYKSTLSVVTTSLNLGADINDIVLDNGYIYAVGGTTKTVKKYRASDMVLVSESSTISSALKINTISVCGNYLLTSDHNGYTYLLDKNTLTIVKGVVPTVKIYSNILLPKVFYTSDNNQQLSKYYINTMFK